MASSVVLSFKIPHVVRPELCQEAVHFGKFYFSINEMHSFVCMCLEILIKLMDFSYLFIAFSFCFLIYSYSGRTQKQIIDFVRENYVKRQNFQR